MRAKTATAPRVRAYPTLKAWRLANGLTQTQAGAKFGIYQDHWSRLENGLQVPHRKLAERLMNETHVPLEAIMGIGQ